MSDGKRWGSDSGEAFAVAMFGGVFFSTFPAALAHGWLGAVSTLGPVLGLAWALGWRYRERATS